VNGAFLDLQIAASKLRNQIRSWQGLCIFFLLRYGQNGGHSASIERAINWLLRSNNDDGGWRDECSSNDEPDILTTILVLDSLRRAGAPTDHESIIRGENGF
jgi:hypothetical protein